jgi:hypothetical protein
MTRALDEAGRSPIGPTPASDIRDEAARLTDGALASGLELRLMGGLAVYLTSPTATRAPYARSYGDLDFAVSSHDSRAAAAFFEAAGYLPERLFNKLHGAQRLNVGHPEGDWPIDVVVDEVRMSHAIDLRGRLAGPGPTIDLADLLLTKLQIWEINEKDLGDVVCLLADHALGAGEGSAIDRRRVIGLAAMDWGLCHTLERNLRRVAELARAKPPTDPPTDAEAAAAALLAAIEQAPKSLGWRARARVGERVRWYETPEEVRH